GRTARDHPVERFLVSAPPDLSAARVRRSSCGGVALGAAVARSCPGFAGVGVVPAPPPLWVSPHNQTPGGAEARNPARNGPRPTTAPGNTHSRARRTRCQRRTSGDDRFTARFRPEGRDPGTERRNRGTSARRWA